MHRLKKYADFIITKAVNLKSGEKLVIWCGESQQQFAQLAQQTATANGADDAVICYADKENSLTDQQKEERNALWKEKCYKLLWIYSEDCTATPPLPWAVVNAATKGWAKQVFPHTEDSTKATEMLWKAIFDACRIDDGNPVGNWDGHIADLLDKCCTLNGLDFEKLHFENSLGTDLWIKPVHNHRWICCTARTADGETVVTNIPTEEVFTSPDRNSANGVVYLTRPLLCDGEKVENLWIRFENGRVSEYGAESNVHLFEHLITSCENADRLGEIAIVPHSSPISQLGLLWHDTSFDENAGCHLALGFAYPNTLADFAGKTPQQLEQMGLNMAQMHEDFVIGSADMKITGISKGRGSVVIFENGEWCV